MRCHTVRPRQTQAEGCHSRHARDAACAQLPAQQQRPVFPCFCLTKVSTQSVQRTQQMHLPVATHHAHETPRLLGEELTHGAPREAGPPSEAVRAPGELPNPRLTRRRIPARRTSAARRRWVLRMPGRMCARTDASPATHDASPATHVALRTPPSDSPANGAQPGESGAADSASWAPRHGRRRATRACPSWTRCGTRRRRVISQPWGGGRESSRRSRLVPFSRHRVLGGPRSCARPGCVSPALSGGTDQTSGDPRVCARDGWHAAAVRRGRR